MPKTHRQPLQSVNPSPLTKGVRILGINYGFISTSGSMLADPDYFLPGEIYSQFTNWGSIEAIDSGLQMDTQLLLEEAPKAPYSIDVTERTLKIKGDLKRLEQQVQDRRWAILGNQGIWFRFALATQERHGIFAFHAASIYHPERNHLVILAGKAGAGKTVYLLSSISSGWQVFSTEMTYFRLDEQGVALYRGSLMDNIYVGSLTRDYPEACARLAVEIPVVNDPWAQKISVDMQAVAVDERVLINPTLSFLFPHVERGLDRAVVHEIEDVRILHRRLFENASEKIGASFLLHEQIPFTGMDTPELAHSRLAAIERLLRADLWNIHSARGVSTGPAHCMEGLPE